MCFSVQGIIISTGVSLTVSAASIDLRLIKNLNRSFLFKDL
jgi:hypothetical protein